MKKSDLRKIFIQKRRELTVDVRKNLSQKIAEKFILQFKPSENQKVHIFLSIDNLQETDTSFLIRYFFETGIRVFVPKMKGKKLISVEIAKNSILATNSWGIEEPLDDIDSGVDDFDYVITPLLCCDLKGNRVGYGKGFYDEFFSRLKPSVVKVGISFFSPVEEISDISATDVPLDYLVTPETVLSFGSSASNLTK